MSTFIKDDYIADRVLFAADEIKRLRAALERLETASGSGEISGSLFKQGEGFVFVGEYIRAALEETK